MNDEKRLEILAILERSFVHTEGDHPRNFDSIDARDRRRLETLLRDDRDAVRFYVEQCQLHSMLAWEHGTLAPSPFVDSESVSRPSSAWRRLGIVSATMAVLAASVLIVFFAGGGVGILRDPSTLQSASSETTVPPRSEASATPTVRDDSGNGSIDPDSPSTSEGFALPTVAWGSRPPVATIGRMAGAVLRIDESTRRAEGAAELVAGDSLPVGRYRLSEGLMSMHFHCGVDVIVQAPAHFVIGDEMRMLLDRGSIAATVRAGGEGFTVMTPSARVLDYGTEFAVEVAEDRDSEVHVFDGRVDVQPLNAPLGNGTVRLRSDQATRVGASGTYPQGIDLDPDRFIRELTEPSTGQMQAMHLIESLGPEMHLRMGVVDDLRNVRGTGRAAVTARIERGSMTVPPFAPGQIGGATRFGGPEDRSYMVVQDYPKALNERLTVCAWVWADSRPRWAAIAKHWSVELVDDGPENVGLGGQFHFGLFEDRGDLEVQVRDRQGSIVSLQEGVKMPLHCWNHCAFVVDGELLTLYRNGREVGRTVCDGLSVEGPGTMGVGAKLDASSQEPDVSNPGFWQGRIDEVAIFHEALTAEQIRRLADRDRCRL